MKKFEKGIRAVAEKKVFTKNLAGEDIAASDVLDSKIKWTIVTPDFGLVTEGAGKG